MKKVTVIIGPQGSGKTTKAIQLCANRKAAFVSVGKISTPIPYSKAIEGADVLVFDGISALNAVDIKHVASATHIFQKRNGRLEQIERPEIIITSNNLTAAAIPRWKNIEIIHMGL